LQAILDTKFRISFFGRQTLTRRLDTIILPPLGVFFKFGLKVKFWICVLLTIVGWIPGIIYAV
ncbi:Proteolipid membrane potential modulator, partial [Dillenia turbinata]